MKIINNLCFPEAEFIPHPLAPDIKTTKQFKLILKAGLAGLKERNLSEVRNILRQLGFVSLWFFLKYITGPEITGDLLTGHLHMDMCNFRQSLLEPGIRAAMFIPRNHFKSTVCTEGGAAWEMLRNPDIRIRITGATSEKAGGFFKTIKSMYEDSVMMRWLYPEWCPEKNAKRWNEKELVLPNRLRKHREGTLEYGGVGGASEGHHFDLHICDDLIGQKQLNADQMSSADMMKVRNWFWGSEKTLLINMKESRVMVIGTRYSADDIYQDLVDRCYLNVGFPMNNFDPNPEGMWKIYYRVAEENGVIIFPESTTKEGLDQMAKDDSQTYLLQYMNDPSSSKLAEFAGFTPKECELDYTHEMGWSIIKRDVDFKHARILMKNCYTLQATDPAASEKYRSSRTSRSACGVLVEDWEGNFYLISLEVGYESIVTVIDWMFYNWKRFIGYMSKTVLESQGAFKLLGPVIREKEIQRREYLNVQSVSAQGEKIARIRSVLQPVLEEGRLYVGKGFTRWVIEELRAFPSGTKMDILDMLALGIRGSIRPNNPKDDYEEELEEQERAVAVSNITGH